MYAGDNKGQWPQTLEELAPRYIKADMLKSPRDNTPYVYVRPANPRANMGATIALYEKNDDPQGQVGVGFIDGHVELMDVTNLRARIGQPTAK